MTKNMRIRLSLMGKVQFIRSLPPIMVHFSSSSNKSYPGAICNCNCNWNKMPILLQIKIYILIPPANPGWVFHLIQMPKQRSQVSLRVDQGPRTKILGVWLNLNNCNYLKSWIKYTKNRKVNSKMEYNKANSNSYPLMANWIFQIALRTKNNRVAAMKVVSWRSLALNNHKPKSIQVLPKFKNNPALTRKAATTSPKCFLPSLQSIMMINFCTLPIQVLFNTRMVLHLLLIIITKQKITNRITMRSRPQIINDWMKKHGPKEESEEDWPINPAKAAALDLWAALPSINRARTVLVKVRYWIILIICRIRNWKGRAWNWKTISRETIQEIIIKWKLTNRKIPIMKKKNRRSRPIMIGPFVFRILSKLQGVWIRIIFQCLIREVRRSPKSLLCRIWHSLIYLILNIWTSSSVGLKRSRSRSPQIIQKVVSCPKLCKSRRGSNSWKKRANTIHLRIRKMKQKCNSTSLKSLKVVMRAAAWPLQSWARHQFNQDKE